MLSPWLRLSLSLTLVPRLLFDGWSYEDYISVLDSEDEIEELGSEMVDVAEVTRDSNIMLIHDHVQVNKSSIMLQFSHLTPVLSSGHCDPSVNVL